MKIDLKKTVHFFAFGFGSGLLTPAPGTWGSLAGLIVSIILWYLTESTLFFIGLTIISFIWGCQICEKASQDLGIHDDGRIVWDEIVAIFLLFSFLPEYNWSYYCLAFLSFRLFDIWKPYPIHYFDQKWQTGLGIMIDDLIAGGYALVLLYFIYWCF